MTTDDAAFPLDRARELVATALDEDLGPGGALDVTTLATIPADQTASAQVVARAPGVVAGMAVVDLVLSAVAERLGAGTVDVQPGVDDGQGVGRGDVLATVRGSTRVILMGERTLLNILCRCSGIATHTRLWADELGGTGCVVLDTRKTTPGLRALEKYAVRAGGGRNKRMGLYDVAMIKDNHKLAAGSITAAFEAVNSTYPGVAVEVEATTVEEALEAVRAGARFLLLDNMSTEELAETVRAVRATNEQVELEATGGLTLEVARAYAMTGVDYLSVGALTHSSPVLDVALDIVPE
ncbi:MAG: carboxylating nicotinate-nucleotide diphosphorylase [Dermatophilaceae bacterium]